jgi:hypothetical protein
MMTVAVIARAADGKQLVDVREGPAGSRESCGLLVMSPSAWQLLRSRLNAGGELVVSEGAL